MNKRREEAERLAKRPYRTIVFLDETTDDEPIYVALNPELDGCVSQGETSDEALRNLHGARVDYIYFLLEDELDVPEPQPIEAETSIFVGVIRDEYAEAEDGEQVYDSNPDYLWPQENR